MIAPLPDPKVASSRRGSEVGRTSGQPSARGGPDRGPDSPPALAPLTDPSLHFCGTVTLAHLEPGFDVAGTTSDVRIPACRLATCNEQLRSIVAEIAGSCGNPVLARAQACGVRDQPAKDTGGAGCGCVPRTSAVTPQVACCR